MNGRHETTRPESASPPFRLRVYSVAFWLFLGGTSVLLFPVAVAIWLLTAPFDRRRVALHRFTCFWSSIYSWLNPAWPVTIEGREKIRPGSTYVMVANHLSLVDILVLFRLFTHFKWVSKAENFSLPFVGWNMSLNGYIKLKRGDPTSIQQMMRQCERTLCEGSSIMMFPEGTRSPTGHLQDFKPGAFEIALKTATPILPIAVRGTAEALPKRGLVLRGRHPITISVLDEIPAENFGTSDSHELASRIHGILVEHLGERDIVD